MDPQNLIHTKVSLFRNTGKKREERSNGKNLHKKADLGSRIDGELELGLFPVVDGEALHEEGGEA